MDAFTLSSADRTRRFEEMYNMYLDGLSFSQIGAKFDISKQRVSQILYKCCNSVELFKLKEAIDKRRRHSWRDTEIINLLRVGNSCSQVASVLKISVSAVKRVSAKHNKRNSSALIE